MPRLRFSFREDLKKTVEKRLKKPIPDAIWETLVEEGGIEVVERGEGLPG